MVADGMLNYCEGSAVVLRMMCSSTADGLQEYCNWFALLRETTACFREIKARMRKTECLGAIFSAEGHFAITAITCAITKFSVATCRHSGGYWF